MIDLLGLAAELVDLPSPSRGESALADLVEKRLGACGWLEVTRLGDNVVARTLLGRRRRVVVAGHLDTVPAAGNDAARIEGDTLWGLGATDMKGALAVMMDLAETLAEPAMDVTWCFYACEEISREDNGLRRLFAERPDLVAADVAILGEPTDAWVEAGCQGTLRVRLHLGGVRAHTARPFTGRNAIHRLAGVLTRVAGWEGRAVVLDGCTYAEQLQAVAVEGGVAANVVPDAASVTLNYRFAPDRSVEEAVDHLRSLLDGLVDPDLGDALEVLDAAPGARPGLDHPLLAALVADTGRAARAKVGWTDVASFAERGIPAANYGPGDPLLAHHPGERVERSSLERVREVLGRVLSAAS